MLGPHLYSFGHPSLGRFFASAVLTFALQSPSSLTWSASVPGLLPLLFSSFSAALAAFRRVRTVGRRRHLPDSVVQATPKTSFHAAYEAAADHGSASRRPMP